MNASYDVKFFETYRNKSSKTPSYVVRWQVAGKRSSKTYRTKALAESFLSDLRQAAKRGEPFDVESGLPASMIKAKSARTVFDFVRAYIDMKWPHAAAKTRDSISDALSTVLPALTKDRAGRPDAEALRTALRKCALIPADKRPEPSPEMARAVRWLEGASLDLADLNETKTVRLALDALALRLDGQAASANTIRRKRAVLHAVLEYAVELEELPSNPLHKVKWKPPKTTETVDPRVVVNPRQAEELLTAVTYVGKRGRGRRLMALFACMYYAALRPGEAVALRQQDCHLPAIGWGRLLVDVSRPEVNTQWTDSGDAHEERGLKHRGRDDVRPVPIPPALVKILRQHIEEFGVGSDGRIFRSERGGVVASTAYTEVWQEARKLAFTPAQVASPLARRPYDLRHAAVSLWLNAGVSAPDVAERAGHSVDVLLRVYAKCLDGQQEIANRRIDDALAA
ncbi:tyrosine-type recombinase/integrase [Microbispora sp. SCL1-1]|uniref:tyrosine-type recombinase/integrase n=1 Tax=unclassified Microbispora TaxID=2614687 RepID=UPI001157E3A1|nr:MULTISPECIES: tyrosine-type recombinase/integrase [unclassified Microbispora]NJP29840.1 tyrosine-type recombinase/integrase [Microbispora sp. CL1-1]TQS03840.1 tyrosine-type recombinase/integrase [Microbispora sp. SCL1-1]